MNSFFHKIKRIFKGSPNEWKNLPKRIIRPGQQDLTLPNNKITTSKYTILTFLPLNLVEQFSKMANIYFLIVGILQMIPAITVSDGLPTEYTPLVVIVVATALKDLIEDMQRHKADKKENKTMIGDRVAESLRVGDFITIDPNQYIPADILLLHSECFVETSQLDGETTLKSKVPIKERIDFIDVPGPNPYLYQFNGSINGTLPLNEQNLLLRGSCLKSLDPIDGVVIYTGHQTKIMLNSHNPRGKVTKMQKLMNKLILLLFLGQWLLCIFCASYFTIALSIKKLDLDYLYLEQPDVTSLLYFQNFWQSVGNWFLLFVNFVPISLMLTLEMIRLFQAYFIVRDPEMFPDTKVQSSNMNDNLGQINHIFSDKTGTLTANSMTFKKLYFQKTTLNLIVDSIETLLVPENSLYLLQILLCNDMKIKNGHIMSSSSDEMALINYLTENGIKVEDNNNQITVSIKDYVYKIEKLFIIPFNSVRKRMSIIVKFENKIYLFTKGADNIIQSRSQMLAQDVVVAGKDFAELGLRVLLFAWKPITEEEFNEWVEKYQKAQIAFNEDQLDELENLLEKDLILSCASGVEDKVSDFAQETIMELQQANIQVWMITGDSYPTACGVAKKVGLLSKRSKIIVLSSIQESACLEKQLFDLSTNIYNQIEACLIILGSLLIELPLEEKHKLVKQAKDCQCVLFCRVSPKQKREIVELFQQCFPQLCTLAIGDGANDVNMITEANVGVGVAGIEGLQAARAADYSIPLFKCLQRLLLYHGRECYRKNTQVVTYNFYKNVLYLIPQFWFGIYNQFSAQSIYDFYVFQCYNFMFTSLPIIVYGVFDIKYYDTQPKKYHIGQNNGYLSVRIFIYSLLEGIYQSGIIFFFTFYFLNIISPLGLEYGLIIQGQIIFFICIIVANTKVILLSHDIHILQVIIQVLSYISYFITALIFNNVVDYSLYGIMNEILSQGIMYLIIAFVSYLALSVIIYYKKYQLFKKSQVTIESPPIVNTSLLSL